MIDGPRLEAKSARTRQLVVLLHGYGADGNDLIDLARVWQDRLPDTAFASPHAPEPCAGAPFGRQWFPLTFQKRNERWDGVRHARPALEEFLDAELARRGLDGEALALVGFSQGTMMALHVGLRRRRSPGAILGYSGLLVGPEGMQVTDMATEITTRPPVLLIHGDEDQVIPPQALQFSADGLAALDVPVEAFLSPGLAHGIDNEGVRLGGDFLARALVSED